MKDIEMIKDIYKSACQSAFAENSERFLTLFKNHYITDRDTSEFIDEALNLTNDICKVAFEFAESAEESFYKDLRFSGNLYKGNSTIALLCEHYLESVANGDAPRNAKTEAEVTMLHHANRV